MVRLSSAFFFVAMSSPIPAAAAGYQDLALMWLLRSNEFVRAMTTSGGHIHGLSLRKVEVQTRPAPLDDPKAIAVNDFTIAIWFEGDAFNQVCSGKANLVAKFKSKHFTQRWFIVDHQYVDYLFSRPEIVTNCTRHLQSTFPNGTRLEFFRSATP